MVFQPDLVNEIEVGVKNLVRSAVIEHSHQKRDNTFHNQCVGICLKSDLAIFLAFSGDPYPALTSFYEIFRSFQVFGEFRKRVAKLYDICISVHPVGEAFEFFNYFVLCFVYAHIFYVILDSPSKLIKIRKS